MKTLLEKLALLEETARTYNKGNRCVTAGGQSAYHIPGKIGCPIGRRIADKSVCEKLDNLSVSGVTNEEAFNLLPESVRVYGQTLLWKLQSLHDNVANWTDTGLSLQGQQWVEGIRSWLNTPEAEGDITSEPAAHFN